jgi:hypothetical protein
MLAEARREQAKLGIFPTAAPKTSSKGWQVMPGAPALVRYLEVFLFQKLLPFHFVLQECFVCGNCPLIEYPNRVCESRVTRIGPISVHFFSAFCVCSTFELS